MKVNLSIRELTLAYAPAGHIREDALRAALVQELTRLLGHGDFASSLGQAGTRELEVVTPLRIDAGLDARDLGASIADSLHGALGGQR